MTSESHYSAKSAASANAFVAGAANENTKAGANANANAAPKKKVYSQAKGISIRIDNLPPGKTWAQVKYLIGGVIYHTYILQVKMLPPMTSMIPPFVTFQSCIVILKSSIDKESLENLLLTLNTYQWDYHDLFVYLLPYANDPMPLRYSEASDNDLDSANEDMNRSVSPRFKNHVSSVTPQPFDSAPSSQYFNFSPELGLQMNENGTPLPTPMSVPVSVPPPPPHGPFPTSMLPILGAPPGALPNMQMPYQATLPPSTAAASGPLGSPSHYPRRRHFYHQNQSQFQKYMQNNSRNLGTGTGPHPPHQHHLSSRNNKINPSYNEISALYNLNMASNPNTITGSNANTNGEDRVLEIEGGGAIPSSQTQINHKRLKHIFNEKSFRKQMTNRGMWQLKILDFPPFIPIELVERISDSAFTELLDQGKYTVIEIREKGQLEKFGRLRWTVLKDFIKLKCPKLLQLQERQFLQQQRNDVSLLNESIDALKISENENAGKNMNNGTYANGGSRSSINNTREFYVGVYEDHEESTLLKFELPNDELVEFNKHVQNISTLGEDTSELEDNNHAKYFRVSAIVYNAIVGFHDKELSDLTFESLQDQEYSLGYKIHVMELPPFDEDDFEDQQQY